MSTSLLWTSGSKTLEEARLDAQHRVESALQRARVFAGRSLGTNDFKMVLSRFNVRQEHVTEEGLRKLEEQAKCVNNAS